jgi:hypothetical protein
MFFFNPVKRFQFSRAFLDYETTKIHGTSKTCFLNNEIQKLSLVGTNCHRLEPVRMPWIHFMVYKHSMHIYYIKNQRANQTHIQNRLLNRYLVFSFSLILYIYSYFESQQINLGKIYIICNTFASLVINIARFYRKTFFLFYYLKKKIKLLNSNSHYLNYKMIIKNYYQKS